MAKQYDIKNLRELSAVLDIFDKKTKKAMANVLKETVEGCYKEIVATSQHKTGSYIASHRIGVNAVDGSDTVYSKKNPVAKGTAQLAALKELSKLGKVTAEDTIYISNSVGFSNPNHYSWAANVEYYGWPPNNAGGYLVYEKAALFAINRIPKYVQYVKSQGDLITGIVE